MSQSTFTSVGQKVRARGSSRAVPPGLATGALAVCGLLALPVVYLLVRSAGADTAAWDLILRGRTVLLAVRSLGLAAAVTAGAVAIGLPLAWLTVRTDLPLRRLWAVLAPLPLVIPSYVGAFVVLSALGPDGLALHLLRPLGVERLPTIAGFPGAWLTLTLFTYPYVYLLAAAALRGQDAALEETSRTLGRSRWSTFRAVTLPLLRPAIAAGGLLVALYALHDFGAVSLLRFQTFTQAIYLQYRAAFDRTPAAILSLMLLAAALVVLLLERRARGRARFHRLGSGAGRRLPVVPLGRWRWPGVGFCALVALGGVGMPIAVLTYWLTRASTLEVELGALAGMAGGSLVTASLGATVVVVLALPVAVLGARFPGRLATTTERLAFSGYALPGIVVALAFVFAGAGFPLVYQTLPLLLLAYTVLFLPQASEPIRSALLQVPPRLEEAGRVLGRTRRAVFRRVVLPQAARGLAAGFALVFLTVMKELPATLLLRPTGFETLATGVWTESSVGQFGDAAIPALVLVTLSAVPLYVVARRFEVQEVRAE